VTVDIVYLKTEILLNYRKNIVFYVADRKVHHDYKNDSFGTIQRSNRVMKLSRKK
jgi:hypothetical protein